MPSTPPDAPLREPDPDGCRARGPRRGLWIVPVVLLAAVVVAFVLVGPAHGGGPAPGFWPWFPFGFLGLVVLVWAVAGPCGRWGWGWGGRGRGYGESESAAAPAEEILRRRYARGEIGADEFRAMSRELRESH